MSPPTAPPKALVFDLDGTLIDSEGLHRETWRECLAEMGIALRESEEATLQGRTGEQVAKWLRSRPGGVPQTFSEERMVERKRALFGERMKDGLTAIEGIDPFLRRHKSVVPLGLVTSAKLKTVGQIMLLFNWRNIFDALIGAEHVANSKPHPEPYLHAAQRLKLAPGEMLVFEDSEVGIESARGAGARVCGVATTLSAKSLRRAGAQWTITDFRDSAELQSALAGRSVSVFRRFFMRAGR